MLIRAIRNARYALPLSLYDIRRLLRARLPFLSSGAAWTVEELMASPKHNRGIRFAELLLRQEAILARATGRAETRFEDARVLEIGCGPLGGYGPLAIFLGAMSYQSADPEWDPALLAHDAVVERYLRVMHADLSALFGYRMTFEDYRTALREKMRIHRGIVDDASIDGPVDVVLSQSVLEHVGDAPAVFARMKALAAADARHLHLVDFGNHYPTENPFQGLYSDTKEAYLARRGPAINLLRVNEMAALADAAGLGLRMTPIRSAPVPDGVHESWRVRADDAALGCQLALLADAPT